MKQMALRLIIAAWSLFILTGCVQKSFDEVRQKLIKIGAVSPTTKLTPYHDTNSKRVSSYVFETDLTTADPMAEPMSGVRNSSYLPEIDEALRRSKITVSGQAIDAIKMKAFPDDVVNVYWVPVSDGKILIVAHLEL